MKCKHIKLISAILITILFWQQGVNAHPRQAKAGTPGLLRPMASQERPPGDLGAMGSLLERRMQYLQLTKAIKALKRRGVKLDKTGMEKKLLEKVYIRSRKKPGSRIESFHYDILAALFSPVADDGIEHTEGRYIYDIMAKKGLTVPGVDRVEIDCGGLTLEDIGEGRGTYREVDKVIIIGKDATVVFTASADKRDLDVPFDETDRHSAQEFENLKMLRACTKLVPEPYGYAERRGRYRVIFREFVEGHDVGLYVKSFLLSDSPAEQDFMRDIFRAVGNAEGRLYRETGYMPSDNHWGNTVIQELPGGGIKAGIIDLAEITNDPDKIAFALANGAGQFASKLADKSRLTIDEIADYARCYFQGFCDAFDDRRQSAAMIMRAIPKLRFTISSNPGSSIPVIAGAIRTVASPKPTALSGIPRPNFSGQLSGI
ncbi:MAG: hypothetical protein ABH825_02820 [Candidatus Omnitrophota bacterium]